MTLSLAVWRLGFLASGGARSVVEGIEKADAGREAVLRSLLAKRLSVGVGLRVSMSL